MKRFLLASALAVAIPVMAHAQSPGATVVDSDTCPITTVLVPGNSRPLVETRQGLLCILESFTGSITIGTVTQGTPAAATFAAAWPTYTPGYSKSNITTATTTTSKSGAGVLHSIAVNTEVASATITVYDNTSATGTKLATITLPSTITGVNPFVLNYDIAFATGLTIVTSGATDLTVSYR